MNLFYCFMNVLESDAGVFPAGYVPTLMYLNEVTFGYGVEMDFEPTPRCDALFLCRIICFDQ